MSKLNPPVITQHTFVFRQLAFVAGLPILYGAIIFYAITKHMRGPRTRALITWKNNILLVRNVADHNRWTLPGGGPKPDESFVASIARELREELSLHQPMKQLHLIRRYDKAEVGETYDKICYSLNLSNEPPVTISLSYEILEARWFSTTHLPRRLSPVVTLALRDHPVR